MSLEIGQPVEFTLLWTEGSLAGFRLQVKGHIRAFRQSGEVVIKLDPMCEAACMWKRDTYKVGKKELEEFLLKPKPTEEQFFSTLDKAATSVPFISSPPTREEMDQLWKDICG